MIPAGILNVKDILCSQNFQFISYNWNPNGFSLVLDDLYTNTYTMSSGNIHQLMIMRISYDNIFLTFKSAFSRT